MTGRQWATMGLLALIWGSSFLFIKWGVAEMPPLMVVAGRMGAGLLFLFAAGWARGVGLPRRALWKPLLAVALFNNVVPWFLIAWGEQHVSSGLASVLNATTPLFSVVIASAWGDERWGWGKAAGLALGFVGVALLVGADLRAFLAATSRAALGEGAILVASASYAVGAVVGRRWLRGESPLQLSIGQLGLASLIILPLAALPANWPDALPSARALAGVAALGLFGSGLAYILFYALLAEVGATRTVVVTYLLPIVALFLGWALLNEVIRWQTLAGMALILGGIGLVNGMALPGVRVARPAGAEQ